MISNRDECFTLVPKDYQIEITKEEKQSDCTLIEGHFQTPFEYYLPGLVPKAAQTARFQVVLPNKWKDEKHKPVCIHLAGTGDHVCIFQNLISIVTYSLFKVFLEKEKSNCEASAKRS